MMACDVSPVAMFVVLFIYQNYNIYPDINFFDAFEGSDCIVDTWRKKKNDTLDTLSIFFRPCLV